MEPGAFSACIAAAGGPASAEIHAVPPATLLEALERHKLVAHSERLSGALSDAQRAALRPMWRRSAARSLAHLAELNRLLPALKSAGLPAFSMKGVVLQQALHGTPTGRDHVDLDVVVAPGHFLAVCRWLLADGYALTGLPESVLTGPLPSALPFHKAGLHLDVHRQIFADFYALRRAQTALERHREGASFDTLGTDLLVMLTGGKDVWSTLRHLSDIARVHARTDRPALAALADQTHTRGIVDTGMRLAERVLALEPSWPATHRVPLDGLEDALRKPRDTGRGWDRTVGYLRVRERWRSRLRFVGRAVTATTYGDLAAIGQGPRLMKRVRRLVKKYGGA